ncbi:SEC10/PgrA surface exclusion domain-containing protein [Apilactobacillus apinorum]|uniref:SCP domain-containing protein n=1 Tax=Apilactobacillus apinorum TaxID=1218495 RepID=A0ABP9ZG19_9LACO
MKKIITALLIAVTAVSIMTGLPKNNSSTAIQAHAKTTKKVKYKSVDAFQYKADKYATKNAKDTLKAPKGFLFYFDPTSKKMVQASSYNDSFIKEGRVINRFHPKIADVKKIVNPTKLTLAEHREISQYTANLINSLRHRMSNNYRYVPDLVVTNEALKMSQDIANGYSRDKWNIFTKRAHDVPLLNSVFSQYPYRTVGENFASSILTKRTSMANVKESIYGAVSAMMFDDADSNWDHTINFLGIGFATTTPIQFGVSIDSMTQIHFEFYQTL